MSKRFSYFEFIGYAEPIRYMLYYSGEKFEDVRLDYKTWPIKEIKDSLPFGKVPLYEEDGKVLHQSFAIARYVAANADLLPSDPWEQAQLDAAVLTIYDLQIYVTAVFNAKEPEEKAKLRKILYEEHFKFYWSRFEKQLKENNGHIGKKLSWADFVLVGLLDCMNFFLEDKIGIEKNYPQISALLNEVHNLPGVKEYIRDRKPYVV